MQVNTRYINSTRGTSSIDYCPACTFQWLKGFLCCLSVYKPMKRKINKSIAIYISKMTVCRFSCINSAISAVCGHQSFFKGSYFKTPLGASTAALCCFSFIWKTKLVLNAHYGPECPRLSFSLIRNRWLCKPVVFAAFWFEAASNSVVWICKDFAPEPGPYFQTVLFKNILLNFSYFF